VVGVAVQEAVTQYSPAAVTVLIHAVLALGIAAAAMHAAGWERAVRAALRASLLLYAAAAALTLLASVWGGQLSIYGGSVVHDRFTSFIVLASAAAALLSVPVVERAAASWPTAPGFHSITPIILFGVYVLSGAVEPGLVLASWLLLSIATYVLVALPGDRDSVAAATRYIYVGTVATLLIALWVALLSAPPSGGSTTLWLAVALAAAGASLGFKIGVFPFHWWMPAVYGRADGRAIALVAAVAKLAFIALLARVAATVAQRGGGIPFIAPAVEPLAAAHLLAAAAVASMTIGNVAALTAQSFQAMLAYSSIAQAGYILVGLAALAYTYYSGANPLLPLAGVALQSLAYAVAKGPLFALAAETGGSLRGSLRGDPVAAASVAVLLASLLGVPFLVGFWGKLYLFLPAADYSLVLVAIALINSGVSSAYYIRFLREAVAPGEARVSEELRWSLAAAAAVTVLAGLVAPLLVQVIAP
jgi:NADH-quinone oxidoreductase subunit N